MPVERKTKKPTTMAPSTTTATSARSRRRRLGHSSFTSYLVFGLHATCCLCLFLFLYILILACLFPLLDEDPIVPTHRGQVFRPVVESFKNRIHNNRLAENMVGKLRQQFDSMRKAQDLTDTKLMDQALDEFEEWRKKQHQQHPQQKLRAVQAAAAAAQAVVPHAENQLTVSSQRKGFMVLGMHRSGTSMLSGLLVQGCGYNVGGPLIGGAFDNPKGFFELIDAVLQNDEFMNLQHVHWAANVGNYNHEKALQAKKDGKITFKNGEKALHVLNNPEMVPWLQKDPRMCITLKTWLPLLNTEPAVLFTYRHPLEVAYSLKKREQDFPIERGLRLWLLYNIRALQNSADLCRVYSSNEAVLADPLVEVQRLSDELSSKCKVPAAPRKITQEDVEKFVDSNLQHNKRELEDANKTVIEEYSDSCKIREYKGDYAVGTKDYDREQDLYLKAMRLYCDLGSGKAYESNYEFPQL